MKHNYIKSMLTALLLLCSTIVSAQDFEVNGIFYNITDATAKTVMVTYSRDDSKYSGNVVIPDKVTYGGTTYSVTNIGGWAFSDCSSLTSIEIPGSVTSIGDYAFNGCSRLTSIVIPNSVTSIGTGTFSHCDRLTSVAIPQRVTSIEDWTFNYCYNLASITIPNGVTKIGS